MPDDVKSDDQTRKDPVTTEDLLEQLTETTRAIKDGNKEVTERFKTNEERVQAIEADQEQARATLTEIKEKLDQHRMSLPGLESEVQKGNISLGACVMARGIAAKYGWDQAREAFPLVFEAHDQLKKRMGENTRNMLTTELGAKGGLFVADQVSGEVVREAIDRTVLGSVNARTIANLMGWPYKVNKQTGRPIAYMVGEGVSIPRTSTDFGGWEKSPRKVAAIGSLTTEQMTYGREAYDWLTEQFAEEVALKVEQQAIEGTGNQYQMLGVAEDPEVAILDYEDDPGAGTGANGRDLTEYHMRKSRNSVELSVKGSAMASYGTVTHTGVKQVLAEEPRYLYEPTAGAAGVGMTFKGGQSDEELRQRYGPIGHTTMLRNDRTKGTNSDIAAVVWGTWAWYWLLIWGGLVVNETDSGSVDGISAFEDDLTWVRVTQLANGGTIKPEYFRRSFDFRTVQTET